MWLTCPCYWIRGAAVTLLRDDTCARITAKKPKELRSWSVVKLVSAGGVLLSMPRVELQLEGKTSMMDIVVVNSLTLAWISF